VVGAELAVQIGKRLGLAPADVRTLSELVRYHLLLPDTATRRDLDDPDTVRRVVDALDGDALILELLHTLAEADSLATGPGVWGEWKASLIGELVRRCRLAMAGEPLPQPDPIDAELLERAKAGGVHVELRSGAGRYTYLVTVIAPDTPRLLSDAAGVLALHSLRVLSAAVGGAGESAIDTFTAAPTFGGPPDAGLLRQELIRAVNGNLDVGAALSKRERESAPRPGLYAQAQPRVLWSETSVPGQVLLELRAEDRLGLLSRLAATFAVTAAEVLWAKVVTMGAAVIDVFCLDLGAGDTEARRGEIEAAVLAVVPQPEPEKPAETDSDAMSGAGY
jgi:[protein-PII] uridylyltransferase